MQKSLLKQCIKTEVYGDYPVKKVSILTKLWCRYFRPRSNSVLLIRKYQYYVQKSAKSGVMKLLYTLQARSCSVKLARRYSIFIHPDAEIGLGMRIIHPAGLYIANVTIGRNATFFQNCTIGVKQIDDDKKKNGATIGDNLMMYANSMIVGDVVVADDVTLGANSCLKSDALGNSVYVGNPAKKV